MQPTKLLLLLLFGITTGCTVGPRFKQPQPEMPSDFASPSSSAKSASVDAAWWRRLNDSTLNDLIHQAAEQNKSLAASQSRLLEARALWREARFDYAPTVRSSVSYENSRSGVSTLNAQRGRSFELYRAGFDASWELDVLVACGNSVKAAKATAAAVEADLNNLRITVSSEVAINYLELRGAQAQLAVARENAANQAESRRIAEVSLKGGRGTQLDVARANALWNDTQAQLPVYEQNVARAIHRIAVLCGRNPSDLRARLQSTKPQPTPPSRLDIVKPADLLRRRPDIRTAEQVLAAQTARVGIAVADLFPRLTFNGRVGLEAGQLSGLSQSGAGGSSFGPHLSWAAFDLGRVRQQIAAAGHRADVALSEYEQTVLLALEEAENALTSYDRERVRLHHLEASAASAREAVTLARQRYQDGIADFLTVLDAERVVLNTQNEIVLSRTRVASAWVSIYKAMGGGWNG